MNLKILNMKYDYLNGGSKKGASLIMFDSRRLAMHIEEDKINLIIYSLRKKSLKIKKTEIIKNDSEDLLKYVKENKLRRVKTDIVLGGKDVISRNIIIPHMPEARIMKALRWELAKHISISLEQIVFDYKIIKDNLEERTLQVLVVAVKKKAIEKYCDIIVSVGLKPRTIDTEGTVFKYLFKNLCIKRINHSCLFFLNDKRGLFSFIVDDQVSFIHNFEINTDIGQEIVNEYMRVLDYLAKNFNFTQIDDIFIFSDKLEPSLYNFLESELATNLVEAEISLNNQIIQSPYENEKALPLFALGLLLREA